MGSERFIAPSLESISLAMHDDNPRIKEYYDLLSGSYDELYGQEQSLKHEKILALMENKKFDLLIDVGCGTGELLNRIATRTSMAIGMDISGEMLRRAREKLSISGAEFVMAACSALPIKDKVADCALSVSVLESDTSRKDFLELSRIVKHGGMIFATVFHVASPSDVQRRPPWDNAQAIAVTKKESLFVSRVPPGERGRA